MRLGYYSEDFQKEIWDINKKKMLAKEDELDSDNQFRLQSISILTVNVCQKSFLV